MGTGDRSKQSEVLAVGGSWAVLGSARRCAWRGLRVQSDRGGT